MYKPTINIKLTLHSILLHALAVALPAMFQSIRLAALPVISTIFFLVAIVYGVAAQRSVEVYGPVVDENAVRITWRVDCDLPDAPKTVVVRYNRAAILANEGDVWLYTAPLPYTNGSAVLTDLNAPSTDRKSVV